MDILKLIVKELRLRKGNTLLSLVAVVTAVALYVGFNTTGAAADRETARLMRDLGFNLRIVPQETDETVFWAQGYASETMPHEYVQRFASQKDLSYRHLLATLQQRVDLGGVEALLTGIDSEVSPLDGEKKPMIFSIDPGTVYVGHHIAARLGLEPGDNLEYNGESLRVVKRLPERGSADDVRVYGHLTDVQRLLELDGRINEIQALECLCRDPNIDSIDLLRAELATLMPEAKVIQLSSLAETREKQRLMTEAYIRLILRVVVGGCALWLGALAMLNVRERRNEIGILRALGYGSGAVAALFLGRAVLLGIVGAAAGFAIGTAVALTAGPDIFQMTAKAIEPMYSLLGWSLLFTPAVTALAALIPAALAVTEDPAKVLQDS